MLPSRIEALGASLLQKTSLVCVVAWFHLPCQLRATDRDLRVTHCPNRPPKLPRTRLGRALFRACSKNSARSSSDFLSFIRSGLLNPAVLSTLLLSVHGLTIPFRGTRSFGLLREPTLAIGVTEGCGRYFSFVRNSRYVTSLRLKVALE